jgi:hypothetical protein
VCRRLFGYTGRLAAELAAAKNFDVATSRRMMNKEQSKTQRAPDRLAIEKSILLRCVFALFVMSLVGCEKKNGDAIVIGKDYVAAVKQREEIKDERAADHEQWIVKVRMRDDGRRIEVRADRGQWEKLRENDQVKVIYRVGKYTGTVWDAEIQ